jgi:hypothetical protein
VKKNRHGGQKKTAEGTVIGSEDLLRNQRK